MKQAKPHKAFQRVNTRKRTWVLNEQGDLSMSADVTLWLDPRGTPTFVFALPEYVGIACSHIALGDRYDEHRPKLNEAGELRCVDVASIERALDTVCSSYRDYARTVVAEPIIVLVLRYQGHDDEGKFIGDGKSHHFTSSRVQGQDGGALVELSYTLAFRVGKRLHSRKERRHDGGITAIGRASPEDCSYVPGGELGYLGENAIVLDYTPELHAELDRIVKVLDRAAMALHAVSKSKDPLAAISGMAQRMLPAPTESDLEQESETRAIEGA